MKSVMTKKQHGMSLSNLLFGAIVLILLVTGGMKMIPAYVEAKTIQKVLDDVAHSPDMQQASAGEIQNAFYKNASVNNVTAVNSQDIIIDKTDPRGLILSVSYKVKIPMAGNVSILMDFDLSSAHPR